MGGRGRLHSSCVYDVIELHGVRGRVDVDAFPARPVICILVSAHIEQQIHLADVIIGEDHPVVDVDTRRIELRSPRIVQPLLVDCPGCRVLLELVEERPHLVLSVFR